MTQVQTNVQALDILGRAVGAGGLEPCEQWITALLDPIVKGPGAGYLHGVELFLPKHRDSRSDSTTGDGASADNASSEPWSFWWKSKEKRDDDDQRRVEEAKQLLTEVVIVREPPLVQVFESNHTVDAGDDPWFSLRTHLFVSRTSILTVNPS